jgi:peptidyl-tRNA hydrolase, PTH1 family
MSFLVVGLGNPGSEYDRTRHNIGFEVLDAWAKKHEVTWTSERHGWVGGFRFKGRVVHVLKPNTYMNLSGKAVSYWMQQHKVKLEHVIVVLDDLAIDLGALRLRLKGSDGGHNGLKSIDQTLGTQQYARLRFGIGNHFPKGRQVDFVLGTWKTEEEVPVLEGIDKAMGLLEGFLLEQKATSLG